MLRDSRLLRETLMRSLIHAPSVSTDLPSTYAYPLVGRVSPVSIDIVVVLPAPFTPSSAKLPPLLDDEVLIVDGGRAAIPFRQMHGAYRIHVTLLPLSPPTVASPSVPLPVVP